MADVEGPRVQKENTQEQVFKNWFWMKALDLDCYIYYNLLVILAYGYFNPIVLPQ